MNVLRHIGSRTFQSTLPLRGATPSNAVNNASSDFNPHSPCGERQTDHETDVDEDEFQSTLPLRGATRALSNPLRFRVFQSTLPLRGATYSRTPVQIFLFISIHTPLAGSDGSTAPCVARRKYFNPHSPCGERLLPCVADGMRTYFNPHSPCGERLRNPSGDRSAQRDFNPHSPCGERHSVRRARPLHAVISIHTPLAGSDVFGGIVLCEHAHISIHTPLAGSDRRDR